MASPSTKSSTKLDYFVVDVFTETPLAGNPLAVVLNTCGLTTEQMQAIAREFNLSETAFVERRSAEVEHAEGVLVRIFTTQEELPFAGHPTLGTASVLKMMVPVTLAGDTVTLALKVGPVPVRFESSAADAGAIFGEMTQREPEFGAELDAAEVAPLLGLAFEDLDPALPPQVVSTGAPFAIVGLRKLEALARLKVNQDAATAWLRERGARWFYVLAPDLVQNAKHQNESATKYRARMQFYGGEDPATGSAAGCAISYLVARDAVPSSTRVLVRQGVEMGRPSELFLSAKKDVSKNMSRNISRVTDVRVAGSTVLVAKGQLFLP
jgi:trans-2,3-dihydro-3-hydroxyanthranilate isomerase